jgi:Tfp pilus assembly protein PilZ
MTITLTIDSLTHLRSVWLPFIQAGGISVPRLNDQQLGDLTAVKLDLFGQPCSFMGKIVWFDPSTVPATVGVQLPATAQTFRHHIETLLTQEK